MVLITRNFADLSEHESLAPQSVPLQGDGTAASPYHLPADKTKAEPESARENSSPPGQVLISPLFYHLRAPAAVSLVGLRSLLSAESASVGCNE